jgi:hypothetical protein
VARVADKTPPSGALSEEDRSEGSWPAEAWPFLIGRSRTEDHRLVVVPQFMTDEQLLRGLLDTAAGEPDEVEVEEIQPARQDPVTVVYRVRGALAADYQLPGAGPLTDEFGRPILLTEGFVVRAPARSLRGRDVLTALDRVHELVTPAYQAFWRKSGEFSRWAEGAFRLFPNATGTEPDRWVDKLAAAVKTSEPTGVAGSGKPVSAIVADRVTPRESAVRPLRPWVVIAVGLFVCVLVAVVVVLLLSSVGGA